MTAFERGLLTFALNVTLDGCHDHREMIADDDKITAALSLLPSFAITQQRSTDYALGARPFGPSLFSSARPL
jgi:hypothetical protein